MPSEALFKVKRLRGAADRLSPFRAAPFDPLPDFRRLISIDSRSIPA
jgi:hypothetical protein